MGTGKTDMSPDQGVSSREILRLSTEIVASYVGRNTVASDQLPEIIDTVYRSISGLQGALGGTSDELPQPAVAVRRSIQPDYIVCLEDGKKLKMLKRHLRTTYGMSPEEYRARWKLPHDYPMVAPNYAKQRSEFAKTIGLGRKPTVSKVGKKSSKSQ